MNKLMFSLFVVVLQVSNNMDVDSVDYFCMGSQSGILMNIPCQGNIGGISIDFSVFPTINIISVNND